MPTKTKSNRTAPAPKTAAAKPPATGRRIQVKRSGVHGKGVFAVRPIAAGDTIIEYAGEVISWEEAQRRHPHDLCDPTHTFYFHMDGDHVIDALFGGNASRWINHSCAPNCEADERDGRIFIVARCDIEAGQELNYDYGLVLDERYTAKLKAEYACHCGHANCRGTMLAPKRGIKLAAPAQPKTTAKPNPTATEPIAKPTAKASRSKAAPADQVHIEAEVKPVNVTIKAASVKAASVKAEKKKKKKAKEAKRKKKAKKEKSTQRAKGKSK